MTDQISNAWYWIIDNREWLFSGAGVALILGLFSLFKHKERPSRREPVLSAPKKPTKDDDHQSQYWHGVRPRTSKYVMRSETRDAISVGVQTFSFEFGAHGHSDALKLRGSTADLHIQFTCRITNPMKAMYKAGDFALNVLNPLFLVKARDILERYTMTYIRNNRVEISEEVRQAVLNDFEKYGVDLQTVTIGNVQKART